MVPRLRTQRLLTPEDVEPSHPDLEVIGVFNPGASDTPYGVALLVRVVEAPREDRPGYTGLPRREEDGNVVIDWVANEDLDREDPRVVVTRDRQLVRLTFTSHLRLFMSPDGLSVEGGEKLRLLPENAYERFGIEDPRITLIDGRYYITYVSVSSHGAATSLLSTEDFSSFERHGIIFPCENKDVVLFPERIGGEYVCFHRPNPAMHFVRPEMWIGRSTDLIHWGQHKPFFAGGGPWESDRLGAGCPPVAVDEGWLEIYHGTGISAEYTGIGIYTGGALLLDRENPSRILKRSKAPVFLPEEEFEREGFVPNVVFPTGIVDKGETFYIYYGAADTFTAVAEVSKAELLAALS
jgi:predicted GH43/DUF377 family glycosyl hydrolase